MEFRLLEGWEQLPPASDALFAAAGRRSLFLTRSWFELLTEQGVEAGQSPCLPCVVAGERLLALLPLLRHEEGVWSAFTHRYSGLYSLLLADEQQDEALDCLADGLKRSGIDRLTLSPCDADDPHIGALQQRLAARGHECHRGFRFYNWFHRPGGQGFDDYLAGRPARLRNTLGRKRRKLEREQGLDIRLYRDRDIAQGLADYLAVYNASWKAKEQYEPLLTALVERAAAQGWLRLAVLYVAGAPAAAQIWLVAGGKASIFRLAHDEQWRQYSPGTILTAFLMQQVIDHDRVEEIDFLTGNERYKQDWMSERRERLGLSCAPGREEKPAGRGWRRLLGLGKQPGR